MLREENRRGITSCPYLQVLTHRPTNRPTGRPIGGLEGSEGSYTYIGLLNRVNRYLLTLLLIAILAFWATVGSAKNYFYSWKKLLPSSSCELHILCVDKRSFVSAERKAMNWYFFPENALRNMNWQCRKDYDNGNEKKGKELFQYFALLPGLCWTRDFYQKISMRREGEAQMCLEHPVLKVSIYSKTFFSEIDSLHIALTLDQGPGKLSPLAPCLAPFF